MPAIRDRGEGSERRRDRLAKLSKGPGTFVYRGGAFDVEWIPTYLKTGKNQPVFDANGMPVLDSSGRQVYERAGQIVRDGKGQPVLGGEPKVEKRELDVFVLRGVPFPVGEPVFVADTTLALKARGMDCLEEVEAIQVEEEPEPVAKPAPEAAAEPAPVAEEPKKRSPGRPRKVQAEP